MRCYAENIPRRGSGHPPTPFFMRAGAAARRRMGNCSSRNSGTPGRPLVVVPLHLTDSLIRARTLLEFHPPFQDQIVVTEFIAQGHLPSHIRRMRALYYNRQTALVEAVQG